MLRRRIALAAAAALLAGPALAGSPTMSTSAGSSPTCGAPGDVCSPAVDVSVNVPAAPAVAAPGLFGLVPGDELAALSFGADTFSGPEVIRFSVASGSTGSAGTAVAAEAGAGEAAADVFGAGTVGAPASSNTLVADGNGLPSAPAATGLPEPADNLDALGTCSIATAAASGALITLAPGSPSLGTLGAGPGDVLFATPGGPAAVIAPAAALGLVAGPPGCAPPVCDAIDALAVDTTAPVAVFSLAPGSPTLTALGAGPADLLSVVPFGGPVSLFLAGSALGLAPTDDVDALDVALDADGDLANDYCDDCPGVPNNDQADTDMDGTGDACAPVSISTRATKLIVVDRLAVSGTAKLVFVAQDDTAGITKGSGTDVGAIGAELEVSYGNGATSGSFLLPMGASDGTSGWLVNKPTVAKYANKQAPGGPTGAKVSVIKPGKLVKLVGKSLGDTPLDIFNAGDPGAMGVQTAYRVTNGPLVATHCSTFPTCAYKLIGGGAGAKLVCRPGDPAACP